MDWFTRTRWVQIVLALCSLTIVFQSVQHILQLLGRPISVDPLSAALLGCIVLIASIVASFFVPNPNDLEHANKIEAANRSIRDAERKAKRAEQRVEEAVVAREDEQERAMAAERAMKIAKAEFERERKLRVEFEKRVSNAEALQRKASDSIAAYEALKAELSQMEERAREDYGLASTARANAEREAEEVLKLASFEKVEADQILAKALAEQQAADQRRLACSQQEQHFKALEINFAEREIAIQNERKASEENRFQASADSLNAIREREQANELLIKSLSAEASSKSVLQQFTDLRNRLFPNWIAEGNLRPSFAELESLASVSEPNSSLLLSYLQLFHSVENHPEVNREFNYLWPTVREIGRFLVFTRTASGATDNEVEESLREWAKTINQVSRGRFTISVPTIGSPFSSSAMESKSGPIVTVTRIHNWSISNSKSIVASKAEVS